VVRLEGRTVDGPEAILIIDPDERRRAFARDVLAGAGYDVRATDDEDEAADLLDRWRPAAVVAVAPPTIAALASRPVILVATSGTSPTVGAHAIVVPASFDRADLLAAVWVALDP
jgi:DNA-binding NtrC family response regulator